MKHRTRHLPLFLRITLWMALCCFGLMTIALGVTLRYNLTDGRQKIDDMLQSTVQMLAQTPMVKRFVREQEMDAYLSAFLKDLTHNTTDLDYIAIADQDSILLYHSDPENIGQPFQGDDQHRALKGERYFSDAGQTEQERRAFHPVYNMDGDIAGFVVASSSHRRFLQTRDMIVGTFLQLYMVLGMLVLAVSLAVALYLRRMLRGASSEDLVRVYLTQNNILNSLDEGLVSYDNNGRIRLVNAAAARMLGHREDLLVGQQVDDLLRAENGESLREGRPDSIRSSRPNILVRPITLHHSSQWARQVLILTDKTETIRYVEELVGSRHMISALRATTHEFLNKLQVISGLLQMGQVSQAQSYIGGVSAHHEHIIGPVMKLIRNANVAALILGKEHNMRELDIRLNLLRNSQLPEQSRYLETEELVTVVGNLLENAMEAIDAAPPEGMRTVDLQITEDDTGLLIMVSDTGEGIREEDLPHIFEFGFSTKARTGRGVGMKLIHDIVERRGGSMDVDTEPGSGTTISIIFGRERGAVQ